MCGSVSDSRRAATHSNGAVRALHSSPDGKFQRRPRQRRRALAAVRARPTALRYALRMEPGDAFEHFLDQLQREPAKLALRGASRSALAFAFLLAHNARSRSASDDHALHSEGRCSPTSNAGVRGANRCGLLNESQSLRAARWEDAQSSPIRCHAPFAASVAATGDDDHFRAKLPHFVNETDICFPFGS